MAGVEQAIEIARPPAPQHVDPDVERGGDRAEPIERRRTEMPALDPRDRRLANARPPSEVGLAPSAPNPDETDSATEPLVAHPRSVASGSLLPLTWPRIRPGTVRPGSRAHAGERERSPRTTNASRTPEPGRIAAPVGLTVLAYLARNRSDVLFLSLIHSRSTSRSDLSTSTQAPVHTPRTFVHARGPLVHVPINSQTTTPSGVPTNATTTSCGFRLTTAHRRRIVSGSLRTIRAASSETPAGPQSPARQPRNTHQSVGHQGDRRSYRDEQSSGPLRRSKA